jgi:hypothetical protein
VLIGYLSFSPGSNRGAGAVGAVIRLRLGHAFAVGWALSLSLMAACSQEAMLQKFASPEEQATARPRRLQKEQ